MAAAKAMDIDLVHSVLFLSLMEQLGTLTPPLGTVMFTTCTIIGVPVKDFIKEILPFWIMLLVSLLLVRSFLRYLWLCQPCIRKLIYTLTYNK